MSVPQLNGMRGKRGLPPSSLLSGGYTLFPFGSHGSFDEFRTGGMVLRRSLAAGPWSLLLGGCALLPQTLTLLAVLLGVAGSAHAQQNSPTIGYVYPAGGRQGTTFEAAVGGQFLQGVADAVISGKGVRAEVVDHMGPLPQKQLEDLRERIKELRQRRQTAGFTMERPKKADRRLATQPAWTDADEKEMAQAIERLETFARSRAVPALGDMVTLKVTIAPDAPPGQRTLRLESALGLTNAMVFHVGHLPEFAEKVVRGAERFGISDEGLPRRLPRRNVSSAKTVDITLPAVVNGQITAGDRDQWRFTARKGQRIVAAVRARQLVPYMADAVPGWFQALVTVYNTEGEELACSDHYRFDPDPVLSWIIPADGQYAVEIADALYRGREDFVYRVTLGPLPFVTSIFPLGGPAGSLTNVQLTGWNLSKTHVAMDAKDRQPGVYPLWDTREVFLNSMPFAIDSLPECLEKEPNDDAGKAQSVDLPIIVNGRIEQAGTWDVFGFQGKAGETIVAEILARRLGSPLDSGIRITDADSKQLAFNDDYTDKAAGLLTHHADSWLSTKLPADGTYYVHVCDMQRKAGMEYAYRLRISSPRPDFDLRVTPSAVNIRGGETVPLTVHLIRRDGFDGPVSLFLKEAPEGFKLSGAAIPAGQDQARVTLTASRRSDEDLIPITIEGRAKVAGREVIHKAVPADDQMQAFAYHHLVPAEQLEVRLASRPFPPGSARILSPTPVRIPAGGEGLLEVAVPSGPFLRQVQVELSDPPEGIRIEKTEATGKGLRILLRCDPAKAKPGLTGNLVFAVFAERARAQEGKSNNRRRFPLGTLPAVPFTVVASSGTG